MDDYHADCNKKQRAALKQKETFLNDSGGQGQIPRSPDQSPPGTKRPKRHVEVGTGRKL
jgi:hypothetical protein